MLKLHLASLHNQRCQSFVHRAIAVHPPPITEIECSQLANRAITQNGGEQNAAGNLRGRSSLIITHSFDPFSLRCCSPPPPGLPELRRSAYRLPTRRAQVHRPNAAVFHSLHWEASSLRRSEPHCVARARRDAVERGPFAEQSTVGKSSPEAEQIGCR